MDSLQTLFRAAMAATIEAALAELPLWEDVSRLGGDSEATRDPTDLLERWQTKRHRTQQLFERQRALACAIRESGGTPAN